MSILLVGLQSPGQKSFQSLAFFSCLTRHWWPTRFEFSFLSQTRFGDFVTVCRDKRGLCPVSDRFVIKSHLWPTHLLLHNLRFFFQLCRRPGNVYWLYSFNWCCPRTLGKGPSGRECCAIRAARLTCSCQFQCAYIGVFQFHKKCIAE